MFLSFNYIQMKKMKFTGKCVIYTRVADSRSLSGLNSQEKMCLNYAEKKWLAVEKVFIDKCSWLSTERKWFNEMIWFIKEMSTKGRSIDFVLVKEVSRITRSMMCYIEIKQFLKYLWVNILTTDCNMDSDYDREMYLDISALFTEFEYRAKGRTTSDNS